MAFLLDAHNPQGESHDQETPARSGQSVDEYYIQAVLLSEVVKRILERRGGVELSSKPTYTLKPVVEFMKRMRVTGLEKFDSATYISAIQFYKSYADLEKHNTLGTVIIYIGEDYIVDILKRLNYPVEDDDGRDVLEDACGTFCNLVAGNFKSALVQMGYAELVMSHFTSFSNEVLDGVEFCQDQKQKYEINFEVDGKKTIVADLVMGNIPGFASD